MTVAAFSPTGLAIYGGRDATPPCDTHSLPALAATYGDGPPMLTIDRYVLRLYVKILLVSFFSLTGLYVVIDAFSNLEELLRIAENEHGLANLLVQYYGARVLTFFDRTSPLLALVAATFVATQLQRSNEMAALMAAGIPKVRIVMPLIAGTIGLSLLAAINREVGIPRAATT